MPKETRAKRTASIAIVTVAMIGSLGFAGTYAFAESTNDSVTVSSKCDKYADDANYQYNAYQLQKENGNDALAKKHYKQYEEARKKYEQCVKG